MISDIRLQNFRSYSDSTFEFGKGVNIIVGPNASGKTNLLEALLIICLGSSYRAKDGEMVRHEKPWAKLDAHTSGGERIVKLEQQASQLVKKSFIVGGQELHRLSKQKSLPIVLFEPEHLQLLNGPPELRREYLDNLLKQMVSGYDKLCRDYRRALTQRNRLLKKSLPAVKSQLFAWDIRLSELGGQIVKHRSQLAEQLDEDITSIYKKLSASKLQVDLNYKSSITIANYSSDLLRKLETSQELDLMRGFTSHGPHRDDLEVLLAGHQAQQTASRGEVRTLILTLKILELKMLESDQGLPAGRQGKKPILLLDDVFSELDGKRRQALTKFLKKYQTFITTTDADVVIQHFMDTATIIPTTK